MQKSVIVVAREHGKKVVYKIPYRRAPRLACVRRASKGILHTRQEGCFDALLSLKAER